MICLKKVQAHELKTLFVIDALLNWIINLLRKIIYQSKFSQRVLFMRIKKTLGKGMKMLKF